MTPRGGAHAARPPPRARPRGRRPRPARPASASQTNVSRLPFGPGQPGRTRSPARPRPSSRRGARDGHERLAPVGRLAHDAALADALAADLELRLDHRERVEARRRRRPAAPGSTLRQRDERDVGDDQVRARRAGRRAPARGRSCARARSRARRCAAPVAARRRRRRRATTCAAPRCSRQSVKPPVEAPTSRQRRPAASTPERVERVGELDPAARDEARAARRRRASTSSATSWPGLAARSPPRPSRTSPAITDAAARARDVEQAALGRAACRGGPWPWRANGTAPATRLVTTVTHDGPRRTGTIMYARGRSRPAAQAGFARHDSHRAGPT